MQQFKLRCKVKGHRMTTGYITWERKVVSQTEVPQYTRTNRKTKSGANIVRVSSNNELRIITTLKTDIESFEYCSHCGMGKDYHDTVEQTDVRWIKSVDYDVFDVGDTPPKSGSGLSHYDKWDNDNSNVFDLIVKIAQGDY